MKELIFSLKTAKYLFRLIQLAIIINLIWLPSLAWSDTGTWAPVNSPSGSSIRQILVDPNDSNTIYAVSLQGGLFISHDRAENWHRVYDQFYDTSKYSDSASFDAGYGNYPSNIALENVNGKTIIYRPSINYSNINGIRESKFTSIISSIDTGASWQSLSRPTVKLTAANANQSFDCIDLYITQATYICGYGSYGKLFRSTDFMTNQWERVEPLKEFPLPGKKSFLLGEVENAMTISNDNPSTIYALGKKDNYTDTSIYKSINAGINWTTVSNKGIGKSAGIYHISTNQFTGALYAIGLKGFFQSLDQGNSWRLLMKKDKKKQLRTVVGINNDNSMLIGTDVGIYRTLDSGKSWQQTTQEVGSVNGFAVDPVDTETIYAATDTGVYISSDAGNTWQLKNNGFYRDVDPNLIVDSANPGTWIVSSSINHYRYPVNNNSNQLSYFVTYDFGMHWQTISPDRSGTFAVNNERYGTGTVSINKKSVSGLIKTVDNGLTWKLVLPVKKSEKNEYFFNPNKTSEIYVKTTEKLTAKLKVVEVDEFANKTYQRTDPYTHYSVTIKKTIDGGDTWSDIRVFRSSIKKNNDDTVLLREVMMTVDPSDFNRTLIGINYGLPVYDSNFKSASIKTYLLQITSDGGLNWQSFRQKPYNQWIKRIVLDKLSYGIAISLDNFDSTPRYSFYFVSNDLATWTEQKAAIFPTLREIRSPLHPNIIYAPFGGFINNTTDNRQSWLKVVDGLPLGRYTDGLVIDKLAQPPRLFTGSRGQIYQLLLQ